MKRRLALVASLLPLTANAERGASEFAAACQRLAEQTPIRVVFADRPVTHDDSRSRETLRHLASATGNPYHRVLGVTVAEPSSRLELTPRLASDGQGHFCAAADLTLTLGFSSLTVYLASELTDACRRRVVAEHEQEHVAVWRQHLRAGARLSETVLRQRLGQTVLADSAEQARDELRRRAETLVGELLGKLADGVTASQRQIDSAASYQFEEGRLRACP